MASPADPRGISVQTPLGPDALFLTGFRGREGISQLFHFQLELMAENRQEIAFDKLIGQKITISILLPDGQTKRFWSGICNSLTQEGRDSTFSTYRMEVVPQLWLLTRRKQSRIFQHLSIPDILKKVLTGLDTKFELQGTFEPRDYCVQYRESDFDFAARLMEEEGIYYFFKHGDGTHQMVVANTPKGHADVPFAAAVIYEELEGGNRPDMRVHRWEKNQELRSGKVTLWDHCFELPNQHLDAERPTTETVEIGKVAHKLKLPANEALEIYEYPGGYAGRFDGIDKGGGDQAGELQKIFQDNKRTALIRMDQEAAQAILIRGSGNCRQFMAGHKFTLERHFNADGPYVLTTVEHSASTMAGRSGGDQTIAYSNHFTCLPLSLPFRPPQTTPRPKIAGPQTATVVGPPGEEIHTDKYSRVKVQFPWDREGKYDADSSCWIRVATIWAGKGYGVIHIPRIGQEVVVDFLEGDPDQPLIIGSVYNAENMPAAELPKNKMVSGLRSSNYPGGAGFNGMVCDDTKGKQKVSVHAQYDMDTTVEHDNVHTVNNDETCLVVGHRKHTVNKSETIAVDSGRDTTIKAGDKVTISDGQQTTITGGQKISIDGGLTNTIKGGVKTDIDGGEEEKITGDDKLDVSAAQTVSIGADQSLTVGGKQTISVTGAIEITSEASITLTVGGSSIKIEPAAITIATTTLKMGGTAAVEIKGGKIVSKADAVHEIAGATVKLN
jgi:type VI secretion system secreted protein VgrG